MTKCENRLRAALMYSWLEAPQVAGTSRVSTPWAVALSGAGSSRVTAASAFKSSAGRINSKQQKTVSDQVQMSLPTASYAS